MTNYMYFEVESVVEQKPLKVGTFAFDLNFYAKKYKAKAKVLKFTCEDEAIQCEESKT